MIRRLPQGRDIFIRGDAKALTQNGAGLSFVISR
jgi:hypothetical protein